MERISEAEFDILNILWSHGSMTAHEVANKIAEKRDWSPRTIKTLLNRLLQKEALTYERKGREYIYTPVFSRENYLAAESERFVNRLFGGKLSPLIATFAEKENLSEQEIADLKKLLDGIAPK